MVWNVLTLNPDCKTMKVQCPEWNRHRYDNGDVCGHVLKLKPSFLLRRLPEMN